MPSPTDAMPQPIQITADTPDPEFNKPIIEVNEWREEPQPHRYIHGKFEGTEARFSFYFPPEGQYEGRIFHNTYPMAITSDIGPFPIEFEVATGDLGFTMDSGAAYVQTNNGGVFRAAGVDPAIAAYRVNAAAVKFAKQVASDLYGDTKTYAYLFGGSGGAYQTLGAAENTRGVWDGFVPFVSGCDHAIPSMFTARMHALRVLRKRDKLPGIADALAVGGSGDPYADLNEEEAAALREVTLMGFPPEGFYRHATMDSGYFANISGMIPAMDPTYLDDFWSKPGYLGTDPASDIGDARFTHEAEVVSNSGMPPFQIELSSAPTQDCADAHLAVLSGAVQGASLPIKQVNGTTAELIMTADPMTAAQLQPGDKVRIDNSWTLAMQTYHRHQLPPTEDYIGWNQFRDADGQPVYPQRGIQVGPTGTIKSAGSMLAGDFDGKMIMLAANMDIDCSPWQADWYRNRAKAAKGAEFADRYTIWFIDRAHHENPLTPLQNANVVSFGGALQQALRDLAAWVEKGERPVETTYTIEESQIVLPQNAADHSGVQPVIDLSVGDGVRIDVAAGEEVTFNATITVPSHSGKVVAAEWDFLGAGDYPVSADIADPAEQISLSASHSYTTPGTYFAVLRATAHRDGDQQSAYGRVQNLAQVRVVVS